MLCDMKQDIVKSNALIEACYKPASLNQMRLLLVALLDIKATDKLSYKNVFTITASGLVDLTGNTLQASYQALSRAADELIDMVITVNARPNGDERRLVKRKINVVDRCDYIDKEGCVKLRFTPSIIPYISTLSSHFTKYKAKYVMSMKSAYSIRLYELCLQWVNVSKSPNVIKEFTVDEFKQIFGLENKYSRIDLLKDKVIKPALREINKHTNIQVEVGYRKAGRRISHIQFTITKKPATSPAVIPGTPKRKLTKRELERQARPGETWEEVKERLKS